MSRYEYEVDDRFRYVNRDPPQIQHREREHSQKRSDSRPRPRSGEWVQVDPRDEHFRDSFKDPRNSFDALSKYEREEPAAPPLHQRQQSRSRDPRGSFDDVRSSYTRDPRASFEKFEVDPAPFPVPLSYKKITTYNEEDRDERGGFEIREREREEFERERARSSSVPAGGPRIPLPHHHHYTQGFKTTGRKTLFLVTALYPWTGDHPGDLDIKPGESISITEEINSEWLRGRNDKTKGYGVFPRSYVVEIGDRAVYDRKAPAPPTAVPAAIPRDGGSGTRAMDARATPRGAGAGNGIAGKLGNAFVFGVGATAGADLVNGLFG